MSNYYRQHQTSTVLYEQFTADSAVHAEYQKYAKMVSDLIGLEKYGVWCDAFIPDAGPWSICLLLVKRYYLELTECTCRPNSKELCTACRRLYPEKVQP